MFAHVCPGSWTLWGGATTVHIPYPVTVPKYYAVASEVATMDLLCSSGSLFPRFTDTRLEPDNAAGTEYIFMEFVRRTKLSDIWFDLGEQQVISVVR